MIYLDNAATTKVCEQSIAAADRAMRELWGNPSSLYNMGFEAKKALDRARRTIADAMGCTEQELYFTACGTESNNIAILGAARARKKWGKNIVVTGYEHPSVGNTVDSLEKEGFEIRRVMPSKYGTVSLDELLSRVDSETALVTAMAVNNETGAVIDIKRLAQGVKSINSRTAVHCDCVQSFLKTKIKLKDTLVDTASVSGHKVHAPKGVGALYVRKGFNLEHSQFGGGQERGLRSGTENTAQILAFAAAVESWDIKKAMDNAARLALRLRNAIVMSGLGIINSPDDASDFVVNFSLIGYRSETVLHFLDERGICVSGGSACSGGKSSHTLTAMGLDNARVDSALRISFTTDSTAEEVDALVDALCEAQKTLVRSGK